MTPSALIKMQRKKLGITSAELARRVGVAKSTVSKWEDGYTDNIRRDNLIKIAEALEISPTKLVSFKDEEPDITLVPVIGKVACGEPIFSDDNIVDYIPCPSSQLKKGYRYIYAQAKGESMEPTIPDGSVVLVQVQPNVEENQICAVRIDGEMTLKRFHSEGGTKVLLPDNRKFKPIFLNSTQDVHIVGVAVSFNFRLLN